METSNDSIKILHLFENIANSFDIEKNLIEIHNILQHPARGTLYNLLRSKIKLKNLFTHISKVSKNCLTCQQNKKYNTKYGKVTGNLLSNRKFESISSDIVGPFKRTMNGCIIKFWIVTFTDLFTRYTKVGIMKNLEAAEVVRCFEKEWLTLYETPKGFLTD